jgi:hypothetical protein
MLTDLQLKALRDFCQWEIGHSAWASDILWVLENPQDSLDRISKERNRD